MYLHVSDKIFFMYKFYNLASQIFCNARFLWVFFFVITFVEYNINQTLTYWKILYYYRVRIWRDVLITTTTRIYNNSNESVGGESSRLKCQSFIFVSIVRETTHCLCVKKKIKKLTIVSVSSVFFFTRRRKPP